MNFIQINAPAKINLGLNIIEKREDGFHNLKTLFFPVMDMADKISIYPDTKFSFSCQGFPELENEENLVVKAVRLLENKLGIKINVKIELLKGIPMGGGLGGGSSDAASTILALNALLKLNLNSNQLFETALSLGSDVPFFLLSRPAAGFSRGEALVPVDFYPETYILIVNPGIHVSTAEAFRNIKPSINDTDYIQLFSEAAHNPKALSGRLVNDFENYIFGKYPQIGKIKEKMLNNNSTFSMMSGSGSTVYGFFDDINDITKVTDDLPENYLSFISRTWEY